MNDNDSKKMANNDPEKKNGQDFAKTEKQDRNEKQEKQENLQKIDTNIEKNPAFLELKDTLQRLQAEFENYQKRAYKERCEFVNFADEGFALSLVPFIESFESAIQNEKSTEQKKHLEILYNQLTGILEKRGFKEINPINEKYDPYSHEAILTEKAEKEEEKGKIVQVLQKGYSLNGRVVRHPKVKIKN